jgi:hypothetical protein
MSAANKLGYLHNATVVRKRHAARCAEPRHTSYAVRTRHRNWLHQGTLPREKCCNQDRVLSHVFLDAFAKLRKATVSVVMSVYPSVRIEQLSSHWIYFHEI